MRNPYLGGAEVDVAGEFADHHDIDATNNLLLEGRRLDELRSKKSRVSFRSVLEDP
jgi:hypothetical protein